MPDDQAIIQRAQTNPQAFGELYDRYYPRIAAYILHRVGDVAVAQDLTSAVFFKAMAGLPRFEWRGLPFAAWLYRIAAHEIASYFRTAQRKPLSLDALYEEYQFEPPAGHDLERDLIARQDQAQQYRDFRLVRRLLQQLPLKYQEPLALRYFEKKSVQEVATITGKNLNTTKSHLARGLDRLRQAYLAESTERPPLQLSRHRPVIETEE